MAKATNSWLVSIERSLRVVSIPHIVFAFLIKNAWVMRVSVQPHASYRMVENRVFECQTLKHHRFQMRRLILTRLAPMAWSFQELYLAHEFLKIGWGNAIELIELRLKRVISLNDVCSSKEITPFLWRSAEAKLLLLIWWNFTCKNCIQRSFTRNLRIWIICKTFRVMLSSYVTFENNHNVVLEISSHSVLTERTIRDVDALSTVTTSDLKRDGMIRAMHQYRKAKGEPK